MHCFRIPAVVLACALRKLVILSAPLAALTLAAAAPALANPVAGRTSASGGTDTNTPGRAQSYRATASESGSVNRLNVYLDGASTASAVDLGMYTDSSGAPASRVGRCQVATPRAGAWNSCAFSAATLRAGRAYWLVVLQPAGSSGTIWYRSASGTGQTYGSASTSLSNLPSSWSNGPDWGAQAAGLYADSSPSASPTPTPTPTPTATPADHPAKASWTAPSGATTGKAVTLDGTGSGGDAPISCVWSFEDSTGSTVYETQNGCKISKAFQYADTKYVRLIVTDTDGDTDSLVHSFPVSAAAAPSPTPSPSPSPSPAPGGSCSLNATPANFASQVAAAQPGQALCLASGSYGTFKGVSKSGTVTIQAASGASASMGLDMNSASNLNFQGLTITGGQIGGTSRNITVGHSNFTGLFAIQTTGANANIVFDGNRHVNLNAPSGSLPARVTVWASGVPSGVTVENSYFAGGDADGVRPDSDSVQVLDNEFADLTDVGGNHTDPIQLYGGTRAVIKGNYFHNANGNISAYIMQADGGDHNIIEDNVFAAGKGVGYGITLYSDNGSIIAHNTWQQGTCDFSIPCGTLSLGNKSGDPASKGTIIRDNILAGLGGGQGSYTEDHNLFTNGSGTGTGDLKGTPSYTGPLTSHDGYRLSTGSLGTHAASDGTDIGIR